MQNPITILLASLIAGTGSLPANPTTFSGKQPVIEREMIEEDVFAMYRVAFSKYAEADPVVMELYDRFEKHVRKIAEDDPLFSAELCLQSVVFAGEKHQGQCRSANRPFIAHPISVALILIEEGGVKDHYTLAAAVLHDSIEDTDATSEEVQHLFGKEVRETVEELTVPKEIDPIPGKKHEWILEKSKNISDRARQVKTADRTDNLRNYNKIKVEKGSEGAKRKERYFTASAALSNSLSGKNPELDQVLQTEIDQYFTQEQIVD